MKCINCGNEIPPNSKFCPVCGTRQIPENSLRANPDNSSSKANGNVRPSSAEGFTSKANGNVRPSSADGFTSKANGNVRTSSADKNIASKGKGRTAIKIIIPVFLAAVAVVLGFFAVRLFFAEKTVVPSDKPEPVTKMFVYAQDGSLYLADAENPEKEAVKLDGVYSESLSSDLSMTAFTPDEKYVCYPASAGTGGTFKLYVKEIESDESAVLLATDVSDYKLLDNEKVIYKAKGVLYLTDFTGDSKKIASGCSKWEITEDQKYLIWMGVYNSNSYNGISYIDTELKQEKKELASSADDLFEMTANGEKIFFMDNNDLYVVENFGEKKKIGSDVFNMPFMDTEGTAYYLKKDENKTFYDLIEDDLLDTADASAPSAGNNRYNQPVNTIREILKNPKHAETYLWQFCMYSKDAEEVLDSGVIFDDTRDLNLKFPAIGYYKKGDAPVTTMSALLAAVESKDIEEYLIQHVLMKFIASEYAYRYCSKNGPVELNEGVGRIFAAENSQKGFGFIRNGDDWNLYTFALSGGDKGKCYLYEEDLSLYGGPLFDGEDIYYYVNNSADGRICNLYKNHEEIAHDVQPALSLMKVIDGILYYESQEDQFGYILNKYDGENSDVIAENVHTYHYIAPDCILMITNCNSKSKEGVLSVYNGKECITLSDHVQAVS